MPAERAPGSADSLNLNRVMPAEGNETKSLYAILRDSIFYLCGSCDDEKMAGKSRDT